MALRIDFEGVSECIDAMNTSIEDLEQAAADIASSSYSFPACSINSEFMFLIILAFLRTSCK